MNGGRASVSASVLPVIDENENENENESGSDSGHDGGDNHADVNNNNNNNITKGRRMPNEIISLIILFSDS